MNRRWAASAVTLMLMAACSGTVMAPGDYFREAQDIAVRYRQVADRLGVDYERRLDGIDADSEEGQQAFVKLTREYFDETFPQYGGTLDALAALSPPGEASEAHQVWLDARRVYHDLLAEVGRRLERAHTVDDVTSAVNGVGLAAAKLAVDRACRAVEAAGSEAGIEVDLDCGVPAA